MSCQPIIDLQPNHLTFTTTFLIMYLLIVHLFFGTASTPSSFCGPILHIHTARAVDFIISLALLYVNTLIGTPTYAVLCQYKASTTQVLEWNVCLVIMVQQQLAVLERHSLAISQLLSGCHSSSVTVLTANTTKINVICTLRNLFLMVRVAYTLEV